MIDSANLIRKINKIARDHYEENNPDFNHNHYLEECFECLIEFFSDKLSENYLFSALSFHKKSDNTKVALVKIKDCNTPYHFNKDIKDQFEPKVEELLKDVFEGGCISVTLTLLNDRNGKDLFFYSKKEYDAPIKPKILSDDVRISFYPLLQLDFDLDVENFIHKNNEKINDFKTLVLKDAVEHDQRTIGKLLWHYKRLQKLYLESYPQNDFIVHFIRPSFIDFDYNILLSLATNKTIEPSELLSFVNLIIYRIVSQMAIEKIKEAERLKRKKSFSLTTHSFKTELKATIIPQINWIIKNINEPDLKELEAQCSDLYHRIRRLDITNIFSIFNL